MKMSGERVIPAPQARVWEALNDPEILKQSIPGCQEMVKHSPTEFSAKVLAKVGPVKANFAGDVSLSNLDPPHSYHISGKGTGGAAGFAEGGAEVRLEEADGGTKLLYDVDAKVGGKLAQIGSRLIDSTARKMADDFFSRFSDAVTDGEARPEAETAAEPEAVVVPEPAAEPEARAEPAAAARPPAKKAPAARKTTGKKTPAKKSAAKKAPAKKTANGKAAAGPKRGRGQTEQRPEYAAEPESTQPPSVMPEAAIASSATPREEPRRTDPQQPASANNIWWLVGAGIAALLVIMVLATF